ncbi:MAG: MotA/TolQ/ExbB proton channel family protein [Erythrobacter sp.]|nr:MotA/TolQ/ExbB proton channel family protein [Erythrobacter sp.]
MPNNLSALIDPGAFLIVMAGTVLACVARCGWHNFGAALREAGALLRPDFDDDANRKALAQAITAIQRDGAHRANPELPPDRALGLMLETYLRHGSIEVLRRTRRSERALDEARRVSAAQVFVWAGELAPVFGLIGTLYGFTQLTPDAAATATTTIMAAISTAVLTSLYGALLAHLLCFPLASAIERHGLARETSREALAEWFADQIAAPAIPPRDGRPHLRGVA